MEGKTVGLYVQSFHHDPCQQPRHGQHDARRPVNEEEYLAALLGTPMAGDVSGDVPDDDGGSFCKQRTARTLFTAVAPYPGEMTCAIAAVARSTKSATGLCNYCAKYCSIYSCDAISTRPAGEELDPILMSCFDKACTRN